MKQSIEKFQNQSEIRRYPDAALLQRIEICNCFTI